jgi:hypothetical protein
MVSATAPLFFICSIPSIIPSMERAGLINLLTSLSSSRKRCVSDYFFRRPGRDPDTKFSGWIVIIPKNVGRDEKFR